MSTLYELSNEYKEAISYLDSEWIGDDEEKKVLVEKINDIKDTLQTKAFNLAKYVNHLIGNVNSIDSEITRLEKIKKSYESREQSLIYYLKSNMEASDIEKIECALFKISIKKCPPKIDIRDFSKIPEEYIKTKIEKSLDKKLMMEHIRQGVIIEGVSLIQNNRLEIK